MTKVTRNTCTTIVGAALIAILALSMAPSVSAQEWDHTIVLSGFGTSFTGDAVFTQFPVQPEDPDDPENTDPSVDVPFDYVLDNREIGGVIEYRASNDTLVIGGELVFIGLSNTKDQPPASAELDMFVAQFDIGHRFSQLWDAYIGLRYTTIEAKGRFEELDGVVDPNFISSDNFLDPVVGIRAFVPLGTRWQVQALGDIGGGFSADTTWQAMANVGFRASDAISVWVGYRAISADVTDAGTKHNLTLSMVNHGPNFGLEINF